MLFYVPEEKSSQTELFLGVGWKFMNTLSFRIIQNFSRFGFLIILAKVYGEAEQFLLLMGL